MPSLYNICTDYRMCVKMNVLHLQCTLYSVQCILHILHLLKTKKFGFMGRGDLASLFFSKSCEMLEVKGDLSISVENKKSLRVDRQACKHYALALTLCAFNNSKSI